MEVHASTRLDLESTTAALRFTMFKNRAWMKWFMAACTMLVMLFGVMRLLRGGVSMDAIFMPALVLAMDALLLYMWYGLPKTIYRKMGDQRDAIQDFVFYDDRMTVQLRTATTDALVTLRYDALKAAYETQDFLYLYQTVGNGYYYVDLRPLSAQARKELTDALRAAMPGGKAHLL